MKRLAQAGTLYVLMVVVGTRALLFLQQVFVVRILSQSAFGQAVYLVRLVGLLSLFAGLGISAGLLKYAAEPVGKEKRKSLFSAGHPFRCITKQ